MRGGEGSLRGDKGEYIWYIRKAYDPDAKFSIKGRKRGGIFQVEVVKYNIIQF